MTILVVDDEARSLDALRRILADRFDVLCAGSAEEAERILSAELVQVVLCDQRMPGQSGVAFLKRVRETWPDTVRMIISGYTQSEDIIAGLNEAGIYKYITKPWHPDELIDSVAAAIELFRLQKETGAPIVEARPSSEVLTQTVARRRHAQRRASGFERIIHTPDSPMAEAVSLARRVAAYDISVCVTGASGAGKELVARAIHYSSDRADKRFVIENCGALPDELLESELFGCKKGAFTGAYQDRIGLFELADGGSIFLDEIGETSPAFQVKLLRVLQEGEIRPLGAPRPRKVNVRVICATNRNLDEEVKAGRFRRDLFYRVNAFPIHIPSLAERRMDVPIIAAKLLEDVNLAFGRSISGFAPATLAAMQAYDWPGNVRELHNEIQRMAALAEDEGPLPERLLSPRILRPEPIGEGVETTPTTLKERIEQLESDAIGQALAEHNGNISRVAEALGLSRVGLRAKIERYDLRRNARDGD